MPTTRGPLAKGLTFAQFALQQTLAGGAIRAAVEERTALPFACDGPELVIPAGAPGWLGSGLRVRKGERFTVSARGAIWLSRPLNLVVEPKSTLWVRIGPEIRKPPQNDHGFTAWADGEVELFSKELSEWASPGGDLISAERGATSGEIRVRVALAEHAPPTAGAPAGWSYLWRLGEGAIYRQAEDGGLEIATEADVGILQLPVDHVITERTRLEWSWKVDALPSRLPEDLALTHDYLSVAVEFEDGRDLTYMWSAGLPRDHVFSCPLDYWCDRETHWVVRTSGDPLGKQLEESRALQADASRAYGASPGRAVRLWLIANSIFQRRQGRATISGLRLVEA